jgi:transcriptional regulator with XRE-family HTH domain
MGQRLRQKPDQLAAKLLAIRRNLKLTQPEIAELLNVTGRRISEFESGRREPNVLVLLRYARLVTLSVDSLIDDEIELKF